MWIILKDSFVSVVEHRDDPAKLLVRARRAADLKRLLPGHKVSRMDDADYPFRVTTSRPVLREALAARVDDIDYGNFKDAVPDKERKAVYTRVWSALLSLEKLARLGWRGAYSYVGDGAGLGPEVEFPGDRLGH